MCLIYWALSDIRFDEMITIKSERDLVSMRRAGQIAGTALAMAGEAVRPGITTAELDRIVRKYIESQGATPSFLGYGGFPASACISINEEVIHGIPSSRKVLSGDIVSIDVGAYFEGFHGDTANTFCAGEVSSDARRLIEVTKESFRKGVEFAREGFRVSDISHAVQQHAEANGFSVVRAYTGHGVGAELHEQPDVPNFGQPGRGPRLLRGMTIAVEPMVNQGTHEIKVLGDKWTVVTADGKLAAHYEHSLLITDGEAELLTFVGVP